MSANDGDVIRKDKFLHFYCLRKSKDPGYYEFKPWDRASRLILDYSSSLWNWKPNFFFISGSGWEFIPSEDLDESPKFFRSWGVPVSGSSFCCFSFLLWVMLVCDILMFLFAVSQLPHLKKRYQRCAKKVKEYLESIKDFDELVSPQYLFLHFFIFWVWNRLLRFGKIWKLWKRVSASFPFSLESLSFCLPFSFLFFLFF